MNNGTPRYRVIRVDDSNAYAPQKGAFRTKQVHYQLADGSRSYVELAHEAYTPEAVHAAISQEADKHEAVVSLNPANPPVSSDNVPNPFT